MLLDDEERRIMATAGQTQLREQRSDRQEREIFGDFFAGRSFAGTKIVELGAGQCDFARLADGAGATVLVIDNDPAVITLARKRGYQAIQSDFQSFNWGAVQSEFDGLFARWSIAPHWFDDPAPLEQFVDAICSSIKPQGWGWV